MEELMINLIIAIGIVYFVVAGSILSIGFYVFQNIIIDKNQPHKKIDWGLYGALCLISLFWPFCILGMIFISKEENKEQ
jgi:uncharacterized BrkB/YihY/UPF0761 family membrane protein